MPLDGKILMMAPHLNMIFWGQRGPVKREMSLRDSRGSLSREVGVGGDISPFVLLMSSSMRSSIQ
jgi:hypothetical protein